MFPFVGSQLSQLKSPSGSASAEAQRYLELAGSGVIGSFVGGFGMRSIVLYMSQIERTRTISGPEIVKSESLQYKGAIHAFWKQIRAGRQIAMSSLFRGSLTLSAMAPFTALGACSMSYHFMDASMSDSPTESAKSLVYGFASVLATEYLISPLRSLYLIKASTSPNAPAITRSEVPYLSYKFWRPGMHSFALSSALISCSLAVGLMLLSDMYPNKLEWRRSVSHVEETTNKSEKQHLEDEQKNLENETGKAPVTPGQKFNDVFEVSSRVSPFEFGLKVLAWPVLSLASNFAFNVGLRQFLNAHSPEVPKYTSALQPWKYQMQAGGRGRFLGILSNSTCWPYAATKIFALAITYYMIGGSVQYSAQLAKIRQEELKE